MSRRFAADNSEVRYPHQAGFPADGAISIVMIVRRRAITAWHALMVAHTSAGLNSSHIDLEFDQNEKLYLTSFTAGHSVSTFTSTTDWLVIGISRPAGASQTVRVHIKNLTAGSAWVHENLDATCSDGTAIPNGSWRVGEWQDLDDLDANIAVDALWCANLSDGQVETLVSSTQQFMDLHGTVPAAFIHEHNQATADEDIVDLTGNGHTATGTISGTTDAVGIEGTAMDTGSDPPGWTYGLAAALQQFRPDADTTTTGWTATPLFSKINDESDATVITATSS